MKPPRLRASARVLLLTLAALAALPAAHAGSVTASGDVSPFPDPNPFSDPMWDTYGPLYIGPVRNLATQAGKGTVGKKVRA